LRTLLHVGKGKAKGPGTRYDAIALLIWVDSRPAALHNFGSDSWLAWANGTTAGVGLLCGHPVPTIRSAARQIYHRLNQRH